MMLDVTVQGETVIIIVSAPVIQFDEFLPEAQKVLDTVEWEAIYKRLTKRL